MPEENWLEWKEWNRLKAQGPPLPIPADKRPFTLGHCSPECLFHRDADCMLQGRGSVSYDSTASPDSDTVQPSFDCELSQRALLAHNARLQGRFGQHDSVAL